VLESPVFLKNISTWQEKLNPAIPDKITCHSFWHPKVMHLFQAGVNLVYIRDCFGHESGQTTEIYARADAKQNVKK
jgi:site-specific recombinase XerD